MIYTPFTQVQLQDDARAVAEAAWLTALQTVSARGEIIEIDALLKRFKEPFRPSVSVGEGWHGLLVNLNAELCQIDPDYQITCIKEKFAGLRVHAEPVKALTPEQASDFQDTLNRYTNASFSVSEISGRPGCLHRKKSGWFKTINPAEAGDEYEQLGKLP